MTRSKLKRNVQLGDIIKLKSTIVSHPGQEGVLGFVYDVQTDYVQFLQITAEEAHRSPLFTEVTGDDIAEGQLPEERLFVTRRNHSISASEPIEQVARINSQKVDEIIRTMILDLVGKHHDTVHKQQESFIPGQTYIRYAGRVYDEQEMKALTDSTLDFWLTEGRFARQFEKKLKEFLGVEFCLLTNSGSSANLLAISALTSPKLGEKSLMPNDEVITVACAFPTTVNPIVQNGLVPVFLDVDIGTYNIQADRIERALTERTKAIFIAHTLGNPFDLEKIVSLSEKYHLWLIEDNCDALGSKYKGQYTGTFGHISTYSFYPAHHITTGEGGALVTDDVELKRIIMSFRDWGRDCWCEPGHDNTCGRRFDWELGKLSHGYDHKFIYSHIGYNLKITDMQAAVGYQQMHKLPGFITSRNQNWSTLYQELKKYEEYLYLPQAAENSEPSWFGFILTLREDAPFSRNDIVNHLEDNKIATRTLFSGNILYHPGFENIRHRVSGNLKNTDYIMQNTFWIGVWPGLSEEMMDFIISQFHSFFKSLP